MTFTNLVLAGANALHNYGTPTPHHAQALVAAGQSLNVEFKRGRRSGLNDDDIVEAVACLANGSGALC